MATPEQIEIAAVALCKAWGYCWDSVAGTDDCKCGEYACDCVAPDGDDGTYERPSRAFYRQAAGAVLDALKL